MFKHIDVVCGLCLCLFMLSATAVFLALAYLLVVRA